jgi:type VI secretion system protein ImpE
MVWMPAHLQFENGGESVALIPTRYPGSEKAEDGLIALARKTVWEEMAPDAHRGLGQRIFATDAEDAPLMEVRTISITGSTETADTTGTTEAGGTTDTPDPAGDHG